MFGGAREMQKWVGMKGAMDVLGVTRYEIDRLVRLGKVRVTGESRGKHSRRYMGEDLERVAEERRNPEPLFDDEGHLNLNGRVQDWTNESFISRLDSCWTFLFSYGYLDVSWREELRSRIEADIARSGAGGRFKTAGARSEFEG
jgi:hypothetical protein